MGTEKITKNLEGRASDESVPLNINAAKLPPQPVTSQHTYTYQFIPRDILGAMGIILGNNARVTATPLPTGKVEFVVVIVEDAPR